MTEAANRLALTLAIIVAFVGVSGAALGYRMAYLSTHQSLTDLRGQVKSANEEAAVKLAELTRQREQEQQKLDNDKQEQEKKDAEAQAEIDRLTAELRDRPFRVRVVAGTGSCGGGSGSAGAGQGGAVEGGKGDAAEAYGVLPPENTGRLAEAIDEIEELNVAYRSCRNTLMK